MNHANHTRTGSGHSALRTVSALFLSLMMLGSLVFVAFSPQYEKDGVTLPRYSASSYMNNRAGQLLAAVTGREPVKVLPYDMSAPDHAPDSEKYYKEDGKDCYRDDTIEVKCWREVHKNHNYSNVPVYFAEVTVRHASQLRRYWANGDYNSNGRQYPSTMFKSSNGVLGMSADYFKHRDFGIIIQYGNVIRNKQTYQPLEVLTVDYNGDFKIWGDKKLSKEIQENGADDIMLSFTFGPALVIDGQVMDETHWEKQELGELHQGVGRAAIGQLGEYHYLLCTVSNPGMRCKEFAKLMGEKGCITAYNLDGGQSSTLLFQQKVYNEIAFRGIERDMSDILYFASAE